MTKREALKMTGGNVSEMCRRLGISRARWYQYPERLPDHKERAVRTLWPHIVTAQDRMRRKAA